MRVVTDHCFPAKTPPGDARHPSPGCGHNPFGGHGPPYLPFQTESSNNRCKPQPSRNTASWCLQVFANTALFCSDRCFCVSSAAASSQTPSVWAVVPAVQLSPLLEVCVSQTWLKNPAWHLLHPRWGLQATSPPVWYACLEKRLHVAIGQRWVTHPAAAREHSCLFSMQPAPVCVAAVLCGSQTTLRIVCSPSAAMAPSPVLQEPFQPPGPFPAQLVSGGQCCWLSLCLRQGSPTPSLWGELC